MKQIDARMTNIEEQLNESNEAFSKPISQIKEQVKFVYFRFPRL